MQSYLIALPLTDNAGKGTDAAHAAFQKLLLSQLGGYTKRPSGEGAWQDGDTGQVYYDRMVPYVIVCDPINFGIITRAAFDLFPDQLALFTQELGAVDIIRRPAKRQPDKARRL